MQKIVDLSYQPKKVEEQEEEISFIGMMFLFGFSIFMAFIVLANICGGRFW